MVYFSLRDVKGNVVTSQAYVPPGRRAAMADADNENVVRIKRQVKGQLNR